MSPDESRVMKLLSSFLGWSCMVMCPFQGRNSAPVLFYMCASCAQENFGFIKKAFFLVENLP